MPTLKETINSPRFAQLRDAGLTEYIAAALNAKEEISEPNPVETPPLVFNGSPTMDDLTGALTDAEVVALSPDELKVTGLSTAAGTPEAVAAAATIIRWIQAAGVYNASVWQVAKASLEENRPDIAQTLFGLVVMSGMMTQARADELGAAMLVPDPAWSDTITTWGQSEAETNGWGFVSVDQIAAAIQGG